MAFQGKKRTVKTSEATKEQPCLTCGEAAPPGTVHCEGSKLAYGCTENLPHHGKTLWAACWKCGGKMGCSLCVPGGYQDRESKRWINLDLICKRCRVKATLEALLNGGPISQFFMRQSGDKLEWGKIERYTPELGEYPVAWARVYAKQAGLAADVDDEQAMRECRRAFEHFRISMIPKTKGHYALLREKNKQAAEMAAKQPEQMEATDADLPEGCWDDTTVERG